MGVLSVFTQIVTVKQKYLSGVRSVFSRRDAGVLSEIGRDPHAVAVADADLSVFERAGIRRVAADEEVSARDLDGDGELIIPSGPGCEHFVGELSNALSVKASELKVSGGACFDGGDVRVASREVLENAFKHGSIEGGDLHVGWSLNESLMIVSVIDQGKRTFDPFVYANEPSPERWLNAINQGRHRGVALITGKGIGGRRVKEPLVEYIDWNPLEDAGGKQQGTKVRMIFKPKPVSGDSEGVK